MVLADWWGAAACRNADPELFFPISAAAASGSDIRRAKEVCASCPVTSRCLSYALAHRQEQGIWGGLTEEERQKFRLRMSRPTEHPKHHVGHKTTRHAVETSS